MPPILRVPRHPESGGAKGTATAPPRRRLAAVTRTRPGDPAMERRPHHRRGGARALAAAVMPGAPPFQTGPRAHRVPVNRDKQQSQRLRRGRPSHLGMARMTLTRRDPLGARVESSQRSRAAGQRAAGSRARTASEAMTCRSRLFSTGSLSGAPSARAPHRSSMPQERPKRVLLEASRHSKGASGVAGSGSRGAALGSAPES